MNADGDYILSTTNVDEETITERPNDTLFHSLTLDRFLVF